MDLIPVGKEKLAKQARVPGSDTGAALQEEIPVYERDKR